MPDIKFKTLEEIPDDLRADAKQVDGGFAVNLVSAKKLSEFRDNNINLSRERDELKARVEKISPLVGEDPTKFATELAELRAIAQKAKDGTLKTTDAIEAEVANRSKAKTEALETQLRDFGTKLTTAEERALSWQKKFERSALHQQITNAVVGPDSIANPTALADILRRAEELFVVQPDGSIVPKKGDAIVYGSDGATPMSPKEWLTKLVAEAPHLGKSSTGGGANGNRDASNNYGMTQEQFQKLAPAERIKLHRQAIQGR